MNKDVLGVKLVELHVANLMISAWVTPLLSPPKNPWTLPVICVMQIKRKPWSIEITSVDVLSCGSTTLSHLCCSIGLSEGQTTTHQIPARFKWVRDGHLSRCVSMPFMDTTNSPVSGKGSIQMLLEIHIAPCMTLLSSACCRQCISVIIMGHLLIAQSWPQLAALSIKFQTN